MIFPSLIFVSTCLLCVNSAPSTNTTSLLDACKVELSQEECMNVSCCYVRNDTACNATLFEGRDGACINTSRLEEFCANVTATQCMSATADNATENSTTLANKDVVQLQAETTLGTPNSSLSSSTDIVTPTEPVKTSSDLPTTLSTVTVTTGSPTASESTVTDSSSAETGVTTEQPSSNNTSSTESTTETNTLPSTKDDTPESGGRRFDPPSFIGGIVLALGLLAIAYVGYKFYRARTEHNYHTL